MAGAVERIVIQTTAEDKKAIAAKAKKLGLPISELMRRGAFRYESNEAEEQLAALAASAKTAADRAGQAINDALAFIEVSNRRMDAMQAKTAKSAQRKPA